MRRGEMTGLVPGRGGRGGAARPQCANHWAPLTRKRHIPPHPAQPQQCSSARGHAALVRCLGGRPSCLKRDKVGADCVTERTTKDVSDMIRISWCALTRTALPSRSMQQQALQPSTTCNKKSWTTASALPHTPKRPSTALPQPSLFARPPSLIVHVQHQVPCPHSPASSGSFGPCGGSHASNDVVQRGRGGAHSGTRVPRTLAPGRPAAYLQPYTWQHEVLWARHRPPQGKSGFQFLGGGGQQSPPKLLGGGGSGKGIDRTIHRAEGAENFVSIEKMVKFFHPTHGK